MQLKSNSELQGGKYRIISVLGQGGFGITYLAENTLLDRRIAIKEFFPKEYCGRGNTSHVTLGTQHNAETVGRLKARFLKEAKNIAKLSHPGVVRVYDVFEENDTAYYVMDYIDGENLSEMVKRGGPLSEARAVAYVAAVGDALDYIHSRNMTHFDVKPANIVVRRSDDRPVLIDFGLSKQYDSQGSATSTLMQGVSQGYSPIELYNIGSVSTFSPQTDVYSLGATLLFLITGVTPPSASQILEDGLKIPSVISPSVSQAIQEAMAISRSKRPLKLSLPVDSPAPDADKASDADSSSEVTSRLMTSSGGKEAISGDEPDSEHAQSEETSLITPADESQNSSTPPPLPPKSKRPLTSNEEYNQSRNTRTKQSSRRTKSKEENDFINDLDITTKRQKVVILLIVLLCFVIYIIAAVQCDSDTDGDSAPYTQQPSHSTHYNGRISTSIGDAFYDGECDENGLPHGYGVAVFDNPGTPQDGAKYDGQWSHGHMSGTCTYTFKDGDTFEGKFLNDQYHEGTYTVKSDGTTFKGSFRNGVPYDGYFSYPNGATANLKNGIQQ